MGEAAKLVGTIVAQVIVFVILLALSPVWITGLVCLVIFLDSRSPEGQSRGEVILERMTERARNFRPNDDVFDERPR